MSEPEKAEAPSGTVTGTVEREVITPEQFMAEMEAAGVAGPEGDKASAPGKPAEPFPGAEAEAKPDVEAKPEDAEKPAEVETKADEGTAKTEPVTEEEPPETKAEDTPEVKAARKIYAAAGRKEAAALRLQQENKQLKGTLEQLSKLRDEDAYEFLKAAGFGKGAETDPIKDLLSRVINKGEPKAAPTPEERIAALEKRLEEERTTSKQSQEAAIIAAAKTKIADSVKAAGDKYDLVNAFEDYDGVTDVMEAYYETHGVPLPWDQAAAAREKYHADKLAKSTKFKAPGPAAQAAKPGTTSNGNKPTSAVPGKSETLTNTDSGRTEPADEFSFDDHDARAKQVAKSLGLGFIRN